jgi:hypothetical protein
MKKATKQEVIETAKTIIKEKKCSKVRCMVCPFYYEFKTVACTDSLGKFEKNPHKVDWFKEWLKKNIEPQLEFDF